jgi:flagellar biosynthesis/type III secretory pathway protein FliH
MSSNQTFQRWQPPVALPAPADPLLEQLRAEAHERARAAGHAEGYAAGYATGLEQGLA